MFKLNKPQDWESITLSELEKKSLLLLRNGFPCGSNNEQEIGIPQLRPMNVDNSGKIDLHQVKFIQVDKIVNNYLIKENDIIFNNTNSHDLIGKTAVWTGPSDKYVLSNHMTFLRLSNDSKIDPYFLAAYFYFLWINRYFESIRRQHVNQASISLERLRDVELPIPPLPEQRAISRVLRAVQQAREARMREIALERERKAALMEHLFRHGTRGEATKETEIGEMPESWATIQLEDACTKVVDCPHSTPNFSLAGMLVVRNFNIRNGQLDLMSPSFTTEDEYAERIKRCEPVEGDILFSREAPVGEACLIPPNIKLCLGQRMMLLRANPLKMNKFFLVQAFYTNAIRSAMMANSSGVTAKHLNVADVKRLKIPLPLIEEQKQIADLLSACDAKIAALEHEAHLHDELFRAMLEELMTGRLRAGALAESAR